MDGAAIPGALLSPVFLEDARMAVDRLLKGVGLPVEWDQHGPGPAAWPDPISAAQSACDAQEGS